MYITFRKYCLKSDYAALHHAVQMELVPILKGCPGFRAHWLLDCSDGDCAAMTVFDTEAEAKIALNKTVSWVQAHIGDLLVLPPGAMFGAAAEEFT